MYIQYISNQNLSICFFPASREFHPEFSDFEYAFSKTGCYNTEAACSKDFKMMIVAKRVMRIPASGAFFI